MGKSKKNWEDMPTEVLQMCIEHLDLESKTALRETSKLQRNLVDSTRKWEIVQFSFSRNFLTLTLNPYLKNKKVISTHSHPIEFVTDAIFHVLTCHKIDTFEVNCVENSENFEKISKIDSFDGLIDKIREGSEISIKNFLSIRGNNQLSIKILKKCDRHLKSVIFSDVQGNLNELFEIQQIHTLNYLKISYERFSPSPNRFFPLKISNFIKNWIDNGADVGKELYFKSEHNYYEMLRALFEKSIIRKEKIDNEIRAFRVKMSDFKHVWMVFNVKLTEMDVFCEVVDGDSGILNIQKYTDRTLSDYGEY